MEIPIERRPTGGWRGGSTASRPTTRSSRERRAGTSQLARTHSGCLCARARTWWPCASVGGGEGFLLVAGIPPAERWDPLLRATREEQRRSELSSLIADAVSAEEAGERAGARALLGEALEFADARRPCGALVRLRIGESHERDGTTRTLARSTRNCCPPSFPRGRGRWCRPGWRRRWRRRASSPRARDAYLRLTRMRDTHPHTISGAHLGLARCLLELGHPQLAARQYERVLRMEDAPPRPRSAGAAGAGGTRPVAESAAVGCRPAIRRP
jgi:hypothetical protein